MPSAKDSLKERLARYRQIKLGVIGRKSGKTISIPVWFVMEGEKLHLLPVKGSDTQWHKNALKNPSIQIDARGAEDEFRAKPTTEANAVKSVIGKFREKYGAGDVKKYYSKFDVAVVVCRRQRKFTCLSAAKRVGFAIVRWQCIVESQP